ncbi:MAG: type II toxin-antitoxin system VapB family antitoxin [Coriobacteriales bacterium]|jgi:Arc/MetJ family transcription regulator|nr:type II toxin-antitoxin system VapB family antitoxin [Coriobacteriales bacterium]
MRTTVTIDDELFEKAAGLLGYSGSRRISKLVNAGLESLIRVESARYLALHEGSEPDITPPSRKRT